MRPTLGQRVTFTATLYRNHLSRGEVAWTALSNAPRSGVYVGMRTVYDGRVQHGHRDLESGYYEAAYFEAKTGITHALVAVHERKAPVRVPFDSLEAQ